MPTSVTNVIIWHWLIKNLMGTRRRNDVDATSLRRIDVVTTSCACWEFGPPLGPLKILNLGPRNILNLPTPMVLYFSVARLSVIPQNKQGTLLNTVELQWLKQAWIWSVDFGYNGPLRQYFSLYRAVSHREGERGEKG